MEERADQAVVAVMQQRIDLAIDRVLRDCIALAAPAPEFLVRVGREPVERFDAHYPHLIEGLLARLDPAGVTIHISIPPDLSSASVRCIPESTVEDLCLELAEEVQQLLVEGELWGAAWPPCPIRDGLQPSGLTPSEGEPYGRASSHPASRRRSGR